MISVESTKMCSCIKVTPRLELSTVPRAVLTVAMAIWPLYYERECYTHFHPGRTIHEEDYGCLCCCRDSDSCGRERRDERCGTRVSGGAAREIEGRFPVEHRGTDRSAMEIQAVARGLV